MKKLQEQLEAAVDAIADYSKLHGATSAQDFGIAAKPILTWLNWFHTCRPHSHAAELLEGARASVLEAAAYAGLGLGRASITSIRTQVDLVLSFSFFREHPAEWRLLTWTGDGFKLRSDIVKYHREMDPGKGGFAERLTMIEQCSKPSLEECYRLLSAHVHGQSPNTMPKSDAIKDLVMPLTTLQQILVLQQQTAKALSAYLMAVHAREWNELPADLVKATKAQLTPAQIPLFFGQ